MPKRLLKSSASQGRKPCFWAKYLTAAAFWGLTAAWPWPGQAQEPDSLGMMEEIMPLAAPPPAAGPAPEPPGPAAESLALDLPPPPARPVNTGIIIKIPPPPWYGFEGRLPDAPPILPGPQPEFEAGQGAWRELDIGQTESPPQTAAGPAVNYLEPPPADEAPAGGSLPAAPPAREQFKDLFRDLFISETDRPSAPAGSPALEGLDGPASGAWPPTGARDSQPRELAGQARIISLGQPGAMARAAAPSSAWRGGAKPYLVLINETGRPETAQEYKRVLEAMGYRIISIHERVAQKGATFISYRPGQRASALELSRRLPGRRLSLEAQSGECLPTEITIHIR